MSIDKARRGRPKGSGLDDRMYLEAMRGLIANDPSLKPTTAIKMLGITDPSAIRRLRDKFKGVGPSAEAEPHDVSAPYRESLEQVTALPQSMVSAQMAEDLSGSDTAVLERAPAEPVIAVSEPQPLRALRIVSPSPVADRLPPAAHSPHPQAEPRADAPPLPPQDAPKAEPQAGAGAARPEGPAPQGAPKATHSFSSSFKPRSHGAEVTTLLVRWYALGMTAALSSAEAQVKVMESVLKVPPVALAIKQQLMFFELAKAFLPGHGKTPKRRT